MHAVLAATTVLAQQSKTIFYVFGPLLVFWAVVLSATGIRRPDFPGGAGGGRLVMGASVSFALAAMVAVVVVS